MDWIRASHLINHMCGILIAAGKTKSQKPKCFEGKEEVPSQIFDFSAKLSRTEILAIIHECLVAETKLTSHDQQKLDNVHNLRRLQLQLNKWKNARNPEKIAEIELQMEALSTESVQPNFMNEDTTIDSAIPKILARGPDHAQYSEVEANGSYMRFLSSVLSLRQPFTPQPLARRSIILQFNGELYSEDCLDMNDTDYVLKSLLSSLDSHESREEAILSVLASLDGEFAFAITDLEENMVYFGKDYFGKRSLLYKLDNDGFIAASVLCNRKGDIHETEAHSVHILNLHSYTIRKVAYDSIWSRNKSEHAVSLRFLSPGNSERNLEERVLQLHRLLLRSCALRQDTIHPLFSGGKNAQLGVLFSGGLDCTVIACLLAENFAKNGKTATIDLLSVGFENPRTGFSSHESPDRKLSVRSWFELCQKFAGSCVSFRLVQVDVSYSEWLGNRKRVLDLIYPCTTEMDLSIAIAFYFACKAENCNSIEVNKDGSLLSWKNFQDDFDNLTFRQKNYTSPAKVLFSGLGADEIFGGYSRHENIFNDLKESSDDAEIFTRYNELSESLVHDIEVIYERNLGRDDRAMTCWGKELRYPYLDSLVIRFVFEEVEPELKVCYNWITSKTKKGEKRLKLFTRKLILRHLAVFLGLPLVAEEIKRAIQFGAKSAKLEIGQSKAKGTDLL